MYVKHYNLLHKHATDVISYPGVLGSTDYYTPLDDDDEEHESFIMQREEALLSFY